LLLLVEVSTPSWDGLVLFSSEYFCTSLPVLVSSVSMPSFTNVLSFNISVLMSEIESSVSDASSGLVSSLGSCVLLLFSEDFCDLFFDFFFLLLIEIC